MDLMGRRVYTRTVTRAHTTRWHSGTAWPRAIVSVSVPLGATGAATCGSERERSGGYFFFQRRTPHAAPLAPRASAPRSQAALIGALFPSLFIIVSKASPSPLAFEFAWPAAKEIFGVGDGLVTHTRKSSVVECPECFFFSSEPNPITQPHCWSERGPRKDQLINPRSAECNDATRPFRWFGFEHRHILYDVPFSVI